MTRKVIHLFKGREEYSCMKNLLCVRGIMHFDIY